MGESIAWGRFGRNLVLALFLCLLLTEGLLRLPALFGADRAVPDRDPSRRYVLCIGDSFTTGNGVKTEKRYPAQLQGFLEEHAPGTFAVVNLGNDGANGRQVLDRLPDDFARYQPDVLIAWVGASAGWNWAKEPPDGDRAWDRLSATLEGWVSQSQIYRFVRVWLQGRMIEEEWRKARVSPISEKDRRPDKGNDARVRQRIARDYRALADFARSANAQLIFVTYPFPANAYLRANQVLEIVAAERSVPVLVSESVLERLPPADREPAAAAHPQAPVYREVARDLAALILGSDVRDTP